MRYFSKTNGLIKLFLQDYSFAVTLSVCERPRLDLTGQPCVIMIKLHSTPHMHGEGDTRTGEDHDIFSSFTLEYDRTDTVQVNWGALQFVQCRFPQCVRIWVCRHVNEDPTKPPVRFAWQPIQYGLTYWVLLLWQENVHTRNPVFMGG